MIIGLLPCLALWLACSTGKGPTSAMPIEAPASETTKTLSCWSTGAGPLTVQCACKEDSDCAVVGVQMDCCGAQDSVGVQHTEVERVVAWQHQCREEFCACPIGLPTNTDDGLSTTPIRLDMTWASCDQGICTSHVR